jgi:hypothetical protein
MVTKWGLSELDRFLQRRERRSVLGRTVTQHKVVSDVTAHTIDEEVRRIVERNYQHAKQILEGSTEKLHLMAEGLMKYETLDEGRSGTSCRPCAETARGLGRGRPSESAEGPGHRALGQARRAASGGAH